MASVRQCCVNKGVFVLFKCCFAFPISAIAVARYPHSIGDTLVQTARCLRLSGTGRQRVGRVGLLHIRNSMPAVWKCTGQTMKTLCASKRAHMDNVGFANHRVMSYITRWSVAKLSARCDSASASPSRCIRATAAQRENAARQSSL